MPRPPEGTGASAILATGAAAEAVIVSNIPLGLRGWDGTDVHLFVLTVIPATGAPYQVQLGNPFPSNALPFVFPGARVPVKVGANPNDVAIDWASCSSVSCSAAR